MHVRQQGVFCQQQDLGELVSDCTELKVIIQCSDLRLLCVLKCLCLPRLRRIQQSSGHSSGHRGELCPRQFKTEKRGERLVRKQHAPQQRWSQIFCILVDALDTWPKLILCTNQPVQAPQHQVPEPRENEANMVGAGLCQVSVESEPYRELYPKTAQQMPSKNCLLFSKPNRLLHFPHLSFFLAAQYFSCDIIFTFSHPGHSQHWNVLLCSSTLQSPISPPPLIMSVCQFNPPLNLFLYYSSFSLFLLWYQRMSITVYKFHQMFLKM